MVHDTLRFLRPLMLTLVLPIGVVRAAEQTEQSPESNRQEAPDVRGEDHGSGRDERPEPDRDTADTTARDSEPTPAAETPPVGAAEATSDGEAQDAAAAVATGAAGAASASREPARDAASVAAPSSRPCRTPRAAVRELIDRLQPDAYDPVRAAQCLDVSRLERRSAAPERARQILEVLDGRGLFVRYERIPNDPEYTNDDGQLRYVLFRALPELYVERVGERWLWSAESVAAAPVLHQETFVLDVSDWLKEAPPWMRGATLGLQGWQWFGLALLLLLAIIARGLVVVLVGVQGRRRFRRVEAVLGDDVIGRVARPLGGMAAAGLIAVLLPALRLPVRASQAGLFAVRVFAVVSAVWAAYYMVDLFTLWLAQRADKTDTRLDDQLVPLIRRALKLLTIALGLVFVLDNLNVDVAGLLAGLGLGGLAFALAAKDTVAHLFGSATIFASRPFQIGDWVYIDGVEGIVESVGFRATRVRTFYNSLVSVPNATVADAVVDNYGERQYRRFKATIGVTYDTTPQQMQAFVEGIRAIVKASPATRKDYYEVHFNGFGDFSLNILLYCFFSVPSWSDELSAKHNMLLEIMRLAKELGVEFAFPTQTLHVDTVAAARTPLPRRRPSPEQLAQTIEGFGPEGKLARPTGEGITGGFLAG